MCTFETADERESRWLRSTTACAARDRYRRGLAEGAELASVSQLNAGGTTLEHPLGCGHHRRPGGGSRCTGGRVTPGDGAACLWRRQSCGRHALARAGKPDAFRVIAEVLYYLNKGWHDWRAVRGCSGAAGTAH